MTPEQAKDFDAALAGPMLVRACGGNPKRVAQTFGTSDRTARRYATGDRSNPAFRIGRSILKMSNPWDLIGYFASLAIRKEVQDTGFLAEWAWQERIREALNEQQGPDGIEDEVSQLFLMGRASPMDLYNAFSTFIGKALRVAGLALYGALMGYSLGGGK